MGLVILGALALYLLLSIFVVIGVIGSASARSKSPVKWGFAAALVMYLIPFWDWLPTAATHRYYCATEAGFWIYKTPEQWIKQNPEVPKKLIATAGTSVAREGDMQNYVDTYPLNQRFDWIVKHNGQLMFNRWRHEQVVLDSTNDEVLARYIDFSTSQIQRQAGWTGWKFWLDARHCRNGSNNENKMGQFVLELKNLSNKGKQ